MTAAADRGRVVRCIGKFDDQGRPLSQIRLCGWADITPTWTEEFGWVDFDPDAACPKCGGRVEVEEES